ncbi:MAG: hypothetical protein AB8H80_23470 [Planctomycetota bacterium]
MKVRRIRTKPCERCGRELDALFRIRIALDGDWVFFCKTCLEAAKHGNPHYVYGGTWKSKKRH